MHQTTDIAAVILAGGLARRMGGGDKPLMMLSGRPILSHIIDRIAPQTNKLIINTNSSEAFFEEFNLPIVADSIDGFAGPLAGILAGMDWVASNMPKCRFMISVPGDGPFIPTDLVEKLMKPILDGRATLSVASSGGRTQPVVGLWDVTLRDELRSAIVEEDIHKVDLWTGRYEISEVDFPIENYDPFFNANRPDDMSKAEDIFNSFIENIS